MRGRGWAATSRTRSSLGLRTQTYPSTLDEDARGTRRPSKASITTTRVSVSYFEVKLLAEIVSTEAGLQFRVVLEAARAMSPSAKQKFLLAHNIPPALEVPPDDTKRGISAHTDASRLRHLAFAVDRVSPLLRHGLHLEFGVRNALSINFLAAKTDAYGAVWDGFDSFVGACTEAHPRPTQPS